MDGTIDDLATLGRVDQVRRDVERAFAFERFLLAKDREQLERDRTTLTNERAQLEHERQALAAERADLARRRAETYKREQLHAEQGPVIERERQLREQARQWGEAQYNRAEQLARILDATRAELERAERKLAARSAPSQGTTRPGPVRVTVTSSEGSGERLQAPVSKVPEYLALIRTQAGADGRDLAAAVATLNKLKHRLQRLEHRADGQLGHPHAGREIADLVSRLDRVTVRIAYRAKLALERSQG